MFTLLFVLFAFASAQNYGELLKKGERHFTSSSLKQAEEGEEVKYDVTFVEGYHSLDYDEAIEMVVCEDEQITIVAKEELKGWKQGDVFTGNAQWGCGNGISKKIEAIELVEKEERFRYVIKAKQATLNDIFETAKIDFQLTDRAIVEGELGLKGASTYSKTFSYSKTLTLLSKKNIQSTLTGTVSVPVTINGIEIDVDSKKNTNTYKMSIKSGLSYSLTMKNTISASVSGSIDDVTLLTFTTVTIPLQIGPVAITIDLKPSIVGSVDYSFNAAATATLKYTKTYSASIRFDSGASKPLTASASDSTPSAKPTFSIGKSLSGECSPAIAAKLDIDVNVYGIEVCSGTPAIKLQIAGELNGRKATITPKLIFDYSAKLLFWSKSGSYTLVTGSSKSISF